MKGIQWIIQGDGDCGFLLSRPEEIFKPTNLDASFEKNGETVKGAYIITSESVTCGSKNTNYRKVEITQMEAR